MQLILFLSTLCKKERRKHICARRYCFMPSLLSMHWLLSFCSTLLLQLAQGFLHLVNKSRKGEQTERLFFTKKKKERKNSKWKVEVLRI